MIYAIYAILFLLCLLTSFTIVFLYAIYNLLYNWRLDELTNKLKQLPIEIKRILKEK